MLKEKLILEFFPLFRIKLPDGVLVTDHEAEVTSTLAQTSARMKGAIIFLIDVFRDELK